MQLGQRGLIGSQDWPLGLDREGSRGTGSGRKATRAVSDAASEGAIAFRSRQPCDDDEDEMWVVSARP